MRANRVPAAAGIEPFTHRPEMLKALPEATASHVADHRKLDVFKGRTSSSSVAARAPSSRRRSCTSTARTSRCWHAASRCNGRTVTADGLPGPFAPLFYAPTDVGLIGISRLVATPNVFRHVPRPAFDVIAARGDPAGGVVAEAADDRDPDHHRHQRGACGARRRGTAGRAVRRHEAQGRPLLFATGYKIDIQRYPFLDNGLAKTIKCVDGYPVLRRGMESSVPKLHFLGAPAARSYGPVMRFVAGSWFTSGAVTRTVLKSPRRRTVDLGRRVLQSAGPDVPGTSLPTHARQALGRHADDRCAGRRRGLPGPGHRPKPRAAGHPCGGARRRDLDRSGPRATSSARSRWTLYASRVRRSRPSSTWPSASACRVGPLPHAGGDRGCHLLEPGPSPRCLSSPHSVVGDGPSGLGQAGDVLLAQELGVDAPRCWFPRTEADLEQVLLGAPVVIKPAIKENFFYATSAKAWRADTPGAAAGRVPSRLPGHRPVRDHRPEMIPGGGTSSWPTARSSGRGNRSPP